MKKAVSLILAGCLAVSLLTGCGSKTAEATQAPAAKKVMTIGDTTFNFARFTLLPQKSCAMEIASLSLRCCERPSIGTKANASVSNPFFIKAN